MNCGALLKICNQNAQSNWEKEVLNVIVVEDYEEPYHNIIVIVIDIITVTVEKLWNCHIYCYLPLPLPSRSNNSSNNKNIIVSKRNQKKFNYICDSDSLWLHQFLLQIGKRDLTTK